MIGTGAPKMLDNSRRYGSTDADIGAFPPFASRSRQRGSSAHK